MTLNNHLPPGLPRHHFLFNVNHAVRMLRVPTLLSTLSFSLSLFAYAVSGQTSLYSTSHQGFPKAKGRLLQKADLERGWQGD